MAETTKTTGGYTAENITWLEGLEAVRHRPGMYIGSTDLKGIFVLCREVLDNSTDEAMGGHANHVVVRLLSDDRVSVEDNGRGIPVGLHPKTGRSALELVMTELHAGGKFDSDNYKVAAGLHGVGVSVVNALSTQTIVEVKRDGKLWRQEYSKGVPQDDVTPVGDAEGTGTIVTYKADGSIFPSVELDLDMVRKRLRELSYLVPTCKFTLENHRVEPMTSETYQNKGGLPSFVEHLNKNKTALFARPIHFQGVRKDDTGAKSIEVEVAIQYNDGYHDTIVAFGNSIHNVHGGLHESGFKTGLTRAIVNYARKKNLLKEKDPKIEGEDVREGLISVVSIKVSDPIFSSQAKERLAGPAFIEGAVNSLVGEGLTEYLEENPQIAAKIVQKAVISSQARAAAAAAIALVKRKSALESDTLPGKLADCSEKDPRECEIYLVEGDSAGGSAKQGRDRRFQAILPLRGKIINVEKNRLDKILGNEEIRAMITAFGTGIAERVNYEDIAEELESQGSLDFEGNPPDSDDVADGGIGGAVPAEGDEAADGVVPSNGVPVSEAALSSGGAALDEVVEADSDAEEEEDENDAFTGNNAKTAIRKRAKGGKVNSAFDLGRLRYDRIIIMCDADVDGSHIRTLLLTFMFRYMRPLVEAGHIYIARPPLYSIRRGKKLEYAYTDAERDKMIKTGGRADVGRFKGLGEMDPSELWETTMKPTTRLLMQVTLEDASEADQIFSILMGDAVEPRKEFIEQNAKLVADLDI